MTMGALLKQARLEAGLSQRQLCGSEITRNMLSQIENGAAKPSMDTLCYLAARLGKPVSYFLEEETASVNQDRMGKARRAWQQGDWEQVLDLLEGYQLPDGVFDAEMGLLRALATMEKAKQAIDRGKVPYAVALLQDMDTASPYFTPELQRQRLLLLGKARPAEAIAVLRQLPGNDDELLLRAQAAQQQEKWERSVCLLDAAEGKSEQWYLLRGEACYHMGQYGAAAEYFGKVETKALSRLESCYEQLGDYKMAYYYAKMRREK